MINKNITYILIFCISLNILSKYSKYIYICTILIIVLKIMFVWFFVNGILELYHYFMIIIIQYYCRWHEVQENDLLEYVEKFIKNLEKEMDKYQTNLFINLLYLFLSNSFLY